MWKVELENNEIISELQCKWDKIKIPIKKFFYVLPNKKTLVLEGFEAYLGFKEIYKFIMGAKGQCIDTINILAKYNNKVVQISYNPIKGKILQRTNQWGKEFTPLIWDTTINNWGIGTARSTNKKCWKIGTKKEQASVRLI